MAGIEKGVGFPITAIDQFSGEFNRLKSKVTEVTSVIGRLNGVLSFLGTGITSFSVTAAFGAMIQAAENAAVAQRKLDAVIRATGNTTGYTADQLSRLADSLARTSSFDDEAFRDATATLMRFGNIGGANLEKVLKLSADYAALTGGDLVSAAEKMGRALSNPVEGLGKLERNFGALAPEVEAAIKQQARMGDASGALGLAIEALQKKIGGADEGMNAGLTGSIKQLRKAISELMEVGGQVADNSAVTGFLDGLSARLRGIKTVMEGDWTMKLLAIMGGQGVLAALGNAKPAAITPSGGGGGILDLGIVDEGFDSRGAANARIRLERIEQEKKAREEWLKNEERLRDLDTRGWVAYAEHLAGPGGVFDQENKARAALSQERFDAADEIRRMDQEGQLALSRNVVKIVEEETKQIEAMRQASFVSFWNEASDLAGNFFSDLVMNGRDAFDNLRKWVKQLLADMLALFAKRWVLNIAAGGSFMGAAGSAMAGGLGAPGDGSIAGGLLGSFGSILPGGEIAAALGNVASMGSSFLGASGSLASTIGSMASFVPVIAAAAVAIAAVVGAINRRGGGPKDGGSFIGTFDTYGALTGTSTERLYTPSGGDPAAREWGTSAATAYFQTLSRFGCTSNGITFGFGYDQDPRGSADSRVSALVRGAGGQTLLDSIQTAGRDDEDFQRAVGLQTRRAILAALQGSELPEAISAILATVDAAAATADQVDAILGLADAFATFSESVAQIDLGGVLEQASRTSTQVFESQGQALIDLANRSSLTTGSLAELTQATSAYRQSAVGLILEFENAKASIDAMFGETGRNIRLAGLDQQGQYNFYQSEAERLFGQLGNAGSADEVTRISGLINRDINAAFNLLSPDQQRSMQQDWLTRLDSVNSTAQQRLEALQREATDRANETLDRIEKIMKELATAQQRAADTQQTAADRNVTAANTPRTIRFEANVPGLATVTDGGG